MAPLGAAALLPFAFPPPRGTRRPSPRRAWLLLGLFLWLLAGPQASAADRLTIILDWFLNADHESLIAAESCGDFARAGLSVRLIPPADTSEPVRLVAAGQADLAIGYQDDLPFLAARHLPVMRVGTLIGQPLNVLIALPGSRIRSLADLKARRVGISVGAGENALLDGMLRSAGLKPSDITRTEINFQIEQALMTGRVDAVMGGLRNYEFIDLQRRGLHPLDWRPEQHGVPPYDELVVVARPAEASDPRIPRFLAALRAGTACLLKDPQAVWQAAIRAHPELDTPLNRAAWWATLPTVARDPAHLDLARYQAFQDFLVRSGALTDPVPVAAYAR